MREIKSEFATSPSGNPQDATRAEWKAWTLFAFLFALAAVSRQSLWIDESLTAVKAMQPDFQAWWASMASQRASDLQMPGYMFYIWAFVRLMGHSEWALRAGNIPWFVAGFACTMRAIPGLRKIPMALVILFCPFAWYYLDEARPYAMQIGSSLMIFASLYAFSHQRSGMEWPVSRWLCIFLFGVVTLSSSSLLGMIWAVSALLCALAVLKRDFCFKLLRENKVATGVAAILLTFLAVYYLWTLKVGARASDVGQTNVMSIGFLFYELLGFAGLGPARTEMRSGGIQSLLPFAGILIAYGVVTMDLLVLGLRKALRHQGNGVNSLHVGLVLALPVLFILAAGVVQHFRVLGRHFAPLLPVLLLLISKGLRARLTSPRWIYRFAPLAYLALSLISCLAFHLASRHSKDDYRDAAGYARMSLQSGYRVWWNASLEGGLYYGLPLEPQPFKNRAKITYLMNPSPATLAGLPVPNLVVQSKPDIFDGGGCVSNYLSSRGFVEIDHYPAFRIWMRSGGVKK